VLCSPPATQDTLDFVGPLPDTTEISIEDDLYGARPPALAGSAWCRTPRRLLLVGHNRE